MANLLLWKEHLKVFYSKYSSGIRFFVKFFTALCVLVSLNVNIGYMVKLRNPILTAALCLLCAVLPWGAVAFVAGCFMIAHVYAASIDMALVALILLVTVGILYFGFRPGDSYLMLLTPLAFVFHIPYAVPLLVGLGGSLMSVIPVSAGVFIYYLLLYIKENVGILTSETSVDIVVKYSQLMHNIIFNQKMLVMLLSCAAGLVAVYVIRRLSMDYSWMTAIVAGLVVQLLILFLGSFLFSVSVNALEMIAGMAVSALIAVAFTFFVFSVDYTRTEHVQFEDDDYYYYVKAVPKMTVSTTDVKVQKISGRKRTARERTAGELLQERKTDRQKL